MTDIRYNDDGTHHRRCLCDACQTRIAQYRKRKSLPNDGTACVGTTRCKCPECTEKRKAYSRDYGKKNKVELCQKTILRNEPRKDEIAAYQANYYRDNKDRLSEHAKVYRAENAEEIAAQRLEYRENNRERINERQQNYYQENREDRLDYAKHFRDEKMDPLYKLWDGIKQRTGNPDNDAWKNYGGRGIGMHEPWQDDFSVFREYILDHLGPKPSPDMSLDRMNNDGNYEPGNIRWATPLMQANNRRNTASYWMNIPDTSPIVCPGQGLKIVTIAQFADITGMPLIVVKRRYVWNTDPAWVLLDFEHDRDHLYQGRAYTLPELSDITGTPAWSLRDKLVKQQLRADDLFPSK